MATEKVTIKMIGKIKEIPTKNGSFKYLNVMCTTGGQYPKDVCFKQSGKTISLFDSFAVGEEVDISFNIDSKVVGSNIFTELSAWKITSTNPSVGQDKKTPNPPSKEDECDLPF